MGTIELIDQKGGFSLPIGACPSMSQSEVGRRCMIGWGADSMFMKGLVSALVIL